MPIEIYVVKIPDELSDTVFENLLSFFPQERVTRIRKFLFRKNALHTMTGEMIMRTWISKRIGVHPMEVQISRDSYGKPHCSNREDLFFNIAHSGQWVAAAFDSEIIGIDVEYMRDIDIAIAKRFFSNREYEDLIAKDAQQQQAFFYDLWTLKESYIKAEGKGLSISLDSFCFTIDHDSIKFELLSGETRNNYFFKHYIFDPLYKCALCSATGLFPDAIINIDFKDLCNDFVSLYKNN